VKCLDATVLVDLLREDPGAAAKVAELEAEGPLATTEANAFELYFGIHLRPERREVAERHAASLLARLEVLPLDRAGAMRAGAIAADLRRRGQDIGFVDVLTAGIALSHGITTVVTRNVGHFRRVRDLLVESY